MQLSNEKALAHYAENPLRYLVQLKNLQHYADSVTCYQSPQGMLQVYPARRTSYDSVLYPGAEWVFLPSAETPEAALTLADFMRQSWDFSERYVFKFIDTQTREVFQQQFGLTHMRTFYSYTTSADASSFSSSDAVRISDTASDDLIELYVRNRYTAEEIKHYEALGALFYAIYEGSTPVCGCLTYQNFGSIWEVAGLHTLERARRKGYARKVAETAVFTLRSRQLIPRYHVESSNVSSVNLAESLGLTRILVFEHWLSQ